MEIVAMQHCRIRFEFRFGPMWGFMSTAREGHHVVAQIRSALHRAIIRDNNETSPGAVDYRTSTAKKGSVYMSTKRIDWSDRY